jgi:hypothetical protein
VLSLILILLVIGVVLGVLLTAWSLWFQSAIYSEPSPAILWGGPAAGAAVMLYLAVWVFLDYRAPGRYREIHEFSPREYYTYPELKAPSRRGEQLYVRRGTAGYQDEYRLKAPPHDRLESRPDKVIVYEKDGLPAPFPKADGEEDVSSGGEEIVFEPARDAQGNFQPADDDLLYYRDARGREMVEGQFGRVTTYHVGWLVGNLLLNFLHLAVWFVCLWLLLRFQWLHALGQALVLWIVTTVFVIPPLLNRAEEVAVARQVPTASQAVDRP